MKKRYIITAHYSFTYDRVYIDDGEEIIKETEKRYETEYGRYSKSKLGCVRVMSKTSYPYITISDIDTTEDELRTKVAQWFIQKAKDIMESDT